MLLLDCLNPWWCCARAYRRCRPCRRDSGSGRRVLRKRSPAGWREVELELDPRPANIAPVVPRVRRKPLDVKRRRQLDNGRTMKGDGSVSAELDPTLGGGITAGEGVERDHDYPNPPLELAQPAFKANGDGAGLAAVRQDQICHLHEGEHAWSTVHLTYPVTEPSWVQELRPGSLLAARQTDGLATPVQSVGMCSFSAPA